MTSAERKKNVTPRNPVGVKIFKRVSTNEKKQGQPVKGIYINLSNILKGTAFLCQGITICGFRKRGRYKYLQARVTGAHLQAELGHTRD